jgi:hypothetical protein
MNEFTQELDGGGGGGGGRKFTEFYPP